MLRIVERPRLRRSPGGVADREEAGEAAGLGLVGVDRQAVVAAAAGMGDVVGAAAERAAAPGVDGCRRPAARARRWSDAAQLAAARRGSARRRRTRRPCRSACSGTRRPLQATTWRASFRPVDLDLQPLDRRIDVAHRAAGARLPRPARARARAPGAARARCRAARRRRSRESGTRSAARTTRARSGSRPRSRSSSTSSKSCQTKCGSMKSSCSSRAPADQPLLVGPLPERGDQAAQQQLLRQAHARSAAASRRRAAPAGRAGRRRVSGVYSLSMQNSARCVLPVDVDQQVAEDAVDQPRRRLPSRLDLAEGDLQLVAARRCAPRRRAEAGWSGR